MAGFAAPRKGLSGRLESLVPPSRRRCALGLSTQLIYLLYAHRINALALKFEPSHFANADYADKRHLCWAHRFDIGCLTVTVWGWATGEFHEHL